MKRLSVFLKRAVDIGLSLIGMLVLIPVLPTIGLLIKIESKGPIFYPVLRIGKGRKPFRMYKFRTMLETPIPVGHSVCPQYDPRVTSFGQFLRRTKINELPQLFNILKGDMTFVGPRPEAPDLADCYPAWAEKFFSVKPGLVSPATLKGRNEEELYPAGADPKEFYLNHILPDKLKLDLDYIENSSFIKDLGLIVLGVRDTLLGSFKKNQLRENRTPLLLGLSDACIILASYILACNLYFYFKTDEFRLIESLYPLPIVLAIRMFCNYFYGLYNHLIRYLSYHELIDVFKSVTASTIVLVLLEFVFKIGFYGASIAVMDWLILTFLLTNFRILLKLYRDRVKSKIENPNVKRRVLIYGVGDEGNSVSQVLSSKKKYSIEVVGFIDDRTYNHGKILHGKKVLGNRHHIKDLAKIFQIDELMVTGAIENPHILRELIKICLDAGIKIHVVTLPHSQPSLNEDVPGLKMPSLEDVLPVEDCGIKVEGLREVVEGKTYLLNGSGDAFGLETCRLLLQMGCKRLIIVERFETYLSELLNTIYNEYDSQLIIPCLIEGPYDKEIQRIVERHRPDVIIHASLRKFPRYDSVDISNFERTNYQQTFAVAKAAVQNGCGMFVLVSSREAENKEGLLGETLRVAETSLKHFFKETPTRFAVARLCDIIDNNRGLIAQLENRIRKGERISISSHDSTTYIISSKSAAAFVVEVIRQRERNAISEPVNVCSYSKPISLVDITSRISMLYSINVWDENKIVFKEEPKAFMPNLSLPDANARVSADTDPEMPPKLSKEEIHKEFKAFVDNFEETWEKRSINREASRLLVLSENEEYVMN